MGWGFGDDGPRDARAALEQENIVDQTRRLAELIAAALANPSAFTLTTSTICELHGRAMHGILPSAGALRTRSDLEIAGSRHQPPPHEDVPQLLDEMCREVTARQDDDPLFLAAYVLWRICWIHPFDNGNGRTARAVSYLVLSVRLGQELPGSRPIPMRIKYAPRAYVRALEAADAACARGALDVSVLQALLAFYLRAQIAEEEPSLPP